MTRVDPAGANASEEDTARDEVTRDDARDADAESHRATDATTTRVVRVVSDSDDESVEEDIAEDDIAEEDIAEDDIADASFSYADASFASDAPEEPRSMDAAPVPSPGPSSPDADDDDAHRHLHHHHRARPPRRSLGERSDVSISVSTSASSPRASATLVASPSSRVGALPPVSPPRAPRRPDSPAFDRGVPPLPPTPTARAPAAARRGGATSPKAQSPPAKRSTTATRTTTRMNPVLARAAELARRRRDAARFPEKRTPTRSKAMERSSTEPATVPSPTRDYLRRAESLAAATPRPRRATRAAAAAADSSPPRRCVRVDLVSALPEFSAAVAAALAASGSKGYLVASDETAEEADAANAPPKARVAVVADAPAVRAAAKPDSAYRPVPAHRTYAWYKHYGFAGKGAKTSWGYNPKREDIKARYDDVKGRGE